MIEPMTRAEIIAELEAELAELPSMAELDAWKPRSLEEAIERTRLRGKRRATEKLLFAQRNRYERT